MTDWRLNGQEDYLSNKTLYKIVFPAFWKTAYKNKNLFYQKIERDAKKYVEAANRGHEYLEGEKIQHFWHEHCSFCWEKALTDKSCTFYCTEDMYYSIMIIWIMKIFFVQFFWVFLPPLLNIFCFC